MARIYSVAEGYVPSEFAHCGLDHVTAATLLFESDPGHFDSAGYLAHIGVELLLKAWLLQTVGQFAGVHKLALLYAELQEKGGAPQLNADQNNLLATLDGYEQLRYPDPKQPIEVGNGDWNETEAFVSFVFRSMPPEKLQALDNVVPGHKAGRVLMRKKREVSSGDV